MQRFFQIAIIGLLTVSAQAAPSGLVLPGAWSSFDVGRPKLEYETLKGYRLFFHPDDPDGERRSLSLTFPMDKVPSVAWAIVRPLTDQGPYADAWLRVEGEPDTGAGRLRFTWDGTYRGQAFPDAPYRFEVNVRDADGDARHWDLLVVKSLEHPRLLKFAGQALSDRRLVFSAGQFQPSQVDASVARGTGSAAILAQVLLPELPAPFDTAGLLVQGRRIADELGQPVDEPWDCLCQQPLPADSPARKQAKKVRCDWDLVSSLPGVWDLRLALYHTQKLARSNAPCDEPLLDEDRIRVRLLP